MSAKKTIEITSIVGNGICVAAEDGEKVYKEIHNSLSEGKEVVVSFKGVEDLTSLFLNTAIGQLYRDISEDILKENLSVIDTNPQDLNILKRSVDRAKEYFKDPQRFHEATKEVLGDG